MRIKKFAVSVLTVASLALTTFAATGNAVQAAVSVSSTDGVVYVTNTNGATIYNEPSVDGDITVGSASLQNATAWKIDKAITLDDATYYEVGTNMWVKSSDISFDAPQANTSTQASSESSNVNKWMYVQSDQGNVNLYDAPNGTLTVTPYLTVQAMKSMINTQTTMAKFGMILVPDNGSKLNS